MAVLKDIAIGAKYVSKSITNRGRYEKSFFSFNFFSFQQQEILTVFPRD